MLLLLVAGKWRQNCNWKAREGPFSGRLWLFVAILLLVVIARWCGIRARGGLLECASRWLADSGRINLNRGLC